MLADSVADVIIYHSADFVPAPQDEYPFKRQRLADDSGPIWLEELHSKIWDKRELGPELFRTVTVTYAHFTQLQERLKQQHPDRDSPQYDGSLHNVQSVKLNFLQSIIALSPRADDGDGSGASSENGPEIGLLFPFNLSFLDLSSLGLKKTCPTHIHLPLFLRQEYDHISTLIQKRPRNYQGTVIVSGQPGTGEILVSLSRGI